MKESTRQKKLGKLVQKELSEIFQREISIASNMMLTVTIVRVTGDLREARAYISVFPGNQAPRAIKELTKRRKEIRGILGQRIRQQVRHIPEIVFYIDDTHQAVTHIESLLAGIKQPDEEE
jgi:ribosome-binding factor A